jgi:hypothetical protein
MSWGTWLIIVFLVTLVISFFQHKEETREMYKPNQSVYQCPTCNKKCAYPEIRTIDGKELDVLVCKNSNCRSIIKNWAGPHFWTQQEWKRETLVIDAIEEAANKHQKQIEMKKKNIERLNKHTAATRAGKEIIITKKDLPQIGEEHEHNTNTIRENPEDTLVIFHDYKAHRAIYEEAPADIYEPDDSIMDEILSQCSDEDLDSANDYCEDDNELVILNEFLTGDNWGHENHH